MFVVLAVDGQVTGRVDDVLFEAGACFGGVTLSGGARLMHADVVLREEHLSVSASEDVGAWGCDLIGAPTRSKPLRLANAPCAFFKKSPNAKLVMSCA